MRHIATLACAALFCTSAVAQTYGEPQGGAQPERHSDKPVGQAMKDSAKEGWEAMKRSGSEIASGAKKGAHAVAQGTSRAAKATKRRIAVAVCNDGSYSYTSKNTCSDHGGIKERLKK